MNKVDERLHSQSVTEMKACCLHCSDEMKSSKLHCVADELVYTAGAISVQSYTRVTRAALRHWFIRKTSTYMQSGWQWQPRAAGIEPRSESCAGKMHEWLNAYMGT